MKKHTIFLIVTVMLMLSGCNKKAAIIDSVQSNIGCNFFNPVMETDLGFYYNDTIYGKMSLHYYDKTTGTTIYLCAKPECAHDGSNFCTATSGAFSCTFTALYDNALYICGLNKEGDIYSLYKASLDGMELTKLVDFSKISSGFSTITGVRGGLLIHRGKAFVPYYIYNFDKTASGNKGGIVMIDLNSLKCKVVEEFDSDWSPYAMSASGDWLYYIDYTNRDKGKIKRFNIMDGTIMEFPFNIMDATYAVIGEEIWYCNKGGSLTGSKINIYNMINGEERKFESELFSEKVMEEVMFEDGSTGLTETYRLFINNEIMYDGTYLYMTNDCGFVSNYFGYKGSAKEIHVFTIDGEHLAEFSYENYEGYYQMSILNGKVYIQTTEKVDACLVEDIINGKVEWTTEVEFRDLTFGNVNDIPNY